MSEKQEKRVVRRTVAIALGIICIVLAVSLVSAVADYAYIIDGKDETIALLNLEISQKNDTIAYLNSQISSKDSHIDSLNTQITFEENATRSLYSQIASKDSELSSLKSQITVLELALAILQNQTDSLQGQVNDLTNTVNLTKYAVWINNQTVSQPADSYTSWILALSYAGYLSVLVQNSTTNSTYVRVIYFSHGISYDNQISVGVGGTAVFPILPSTSIQLRVGNTNPVDGATETVTATYFY